MGGPELPSLLFQYIIIISLPNQRTVKGKKGKTDAHSDHVQFNDQKPY